MSTPILPLSGPSSSTNSRGRWGQSNGFGGSTGRGLGIELDVEDELRFGRGGIPLILRRLVKFRSMDFELAFWQLTYLVVAPRRVYKQTYHHKQTKNQWARDDPAMLLLIAGCLAVSGIAWSLVYQFPPSTLITLPLLMIFRDFLLPSLVIASILYFISNRLLLAPSLPNASTSDNRVEFAYSFDVAVNAFFPAWLTVGVGLLGLGMVVVKDNWVCLWVGNTLFLVAQVQYVYVTYLGYAALPFVARSQLLLSPLLPIFGGYLLSLLGFNIAKHALEYYFGKSWN
ncbi:uncharacterized protein L203_104653 [Cryptococcus depauperatus CBS 7841]|uniref:Uncharacterized protein n=1 Tax=Cryptococcus depauperatus CBS 7841 TaxID=1295531 RepID=A0A1E3ILF3_9TREE|nr:UNC-50 family protein [Cryptococcus depauperatus CBS 7841]